MPKLREPPKKPEPQLKTTPEEHDRFEVQDDEENPEVEVKEPELKPKVDDAAEELKKQIEALKRSEQAARQEAAQAKLDRETMLRRAQEREAEFSRLQTETSQSQLDAITNAMAAAETQIESAKRLIRSAASEGDIDAQIAAQDQLAEARANLVNLTNGKAALEAEAKAAKEKPKPEPVTEDPLDRTNLPDTAKRWLRAHPDYLTDPRKNAKIQALHWDVVDEGHQPFSDAYYESLEQHLGLRSKPRQDVAEEEEDEPQERVAVSAPVSRNVPSSSGTRLRAGDVKLTKAQREAAALAGITEAEYAKQLVRLADEKSSGNYGGAP